MLVVVHKVKPRHDVHEHTSISALSARHTLHVFRHSADAVQRLALLHLVRHLTHIHLDLAAVLGEAVEAVDAAAVEEVEAREQAEGSGQPHDLAEPVAADLGRGDALPEEHGAGDQGGEAKGGRVVGGAGIADHAAEVRVRVNQLGSG